MTANRIKFGFLLSEYSPATESLALGVSAEALGFDSVWMADEATALGSSVASEQWTALASLGALTKRVNLGTAVADCFRIHPSKLAQLTASLDALTLGRAALGIGAGEALNLVPYGIEWNPADRRAVAVNEAIKVIKLLWANASSERADFKGRFYSLEDAGLDVQFIAEPHPPIYVGAMSNRIMLETTGELGDGWLPWVTSPFVWERRLKLILDSALKSGRKKSEIDCCVYVIPFIGDDLKMLTKLRKALKFDLVIERSTLLSHGVDLELPMAYGLQHSHFAPDEIRKINQRAEQIPDEFLEKNAILLAGQPDSIVESIAKYAKLGANHVIIADFTRSTANTISLMRTFSNHIIPHFQ